MKLKLSPLIATIFFALFAPVASAQQVDCTGWISDRTVVTRAFWEFVHVEVVSACIKAGADVNARDVLGFTPLLFAAEYTDNPAVITALIKAGANANAANDDGETPFDLAKGNDAIKGSDVYWALNDARFK